MAAFIVAEYLLGSTSKEVSVNCTAIVLCRYNYKPVITKIIFRLINRIPRHENLSPYLKMRSISSFFLNNSVLVRLLLITDGKAISSLGSSSSKNLASAFCSHSSAESKLSCSLSLTRLVSSDTFSAHI